MLEEQRAKIDELDSKIVPLLEERMSVVQKVAEIKANTDMDVLDEGREALILQKIAGSVKNPAFEKALLEVYKAVLSSSRNFQQEKIEDEK